MNSKLTAILGVVTVVALAFLAYSCGTQPNCPTCGTTVNGAYGVLDVIPVPEHNPTGEPGGPFNSFDISWFDPIQRLFYVSDRIGLDVVVIDTKNNFAVNTIGGLNEVANAGNNASPCLPGIPSIVTGAGALRDPAGANVLTRFGCRNPGFFDSFSTFFPGFGANGMFGGFPGAQCCAARANGVNPLSGPDGLLVTPDGKTLFVGSGSSSIVAFDLSTIATAGVATVLAAFPTGSSPDFDGPANPRTGVPSYGGIANCVQSWNGGAGSDPTCGDDRADEMSYGTVNGRNILMVSNGDPGMPFVTLIDVTDIVSRAPSGAKTGYCLPANSALNYNPGLPGSTQPFNHANYPTCILGQIYYDGSPVNDSTVAVDHAGAPCPDPSEAVASGVSGRNALFGTDVPCHHSAVVDVNTGAFIPPVAGVQTAVGSTQAGELAPAGIGASAFNPFHNTFYVENSNCTVSTLATQASVAVGCIDEIDPRIGNTACTTVIGGSCGPVVVNVIPVLNCMPAGIVQGPGHDFLVGCGGHDGIAFPPLMIIFDGMTNKIVASITQTGGTDEVWFNSGDGRYYTAGRDMPNGAVMGVIDAATRTWLVNVPTGSNSHSIAADPFTNHILVPLQAAPRCNTQSANGCVAVYGRQ